MNTRWFIPWVTMVLLLGAVAVAGAAGVLALQDVDGTLGTGSATWHRPMSGGFDATFLGCGAPLAGASAADCYYDVHGFLVDTTAPIEIDVAADPPDFDLMLFLYCSFDPEAPLADAILADDEDGPFPWGPGVMLDDGVTLTPGTYYFLVVTTFEPGTTGSYTITATNAVPADGMSWGAIKSLYR